MWLGDNDIFTEENYKGGGCDSVIVELANGLQCGAMVVLCFTKSNVREDKINAEMAAVLQVTISQGLRKTWLPSIVSFVLDLANGVGLSTPEISVARICMALLLWWSGEVCMALLAVGCSPPKASPCLHPD